MLALGVAAGIGIRARLVLAADFPLNDGGLFSVMIDAVRASGAALPWSVSYNGLEIPFAYPPLAFLAAAGLTHAGVSTLDTLRVLPLAANVVALGAFMPLARTVLPSRASAGIATGIFALMPGSYVWQIMGGGLTRSFGFCFALLGLTAAYHIVTAGRRSDAVLLGVAAALAGLSHLEMAWFLTVGTACLLLGFGRGWRALLGILAAAVIAVVLASPWWLTVVARHGPGPLLAASQTGSVMTGLFARDAGAGPDLAGPIAAIVTLAVSTGLVLSGRRRFIIVGCLGLLFLLDTRSFGWLSAVPLALALGGFAAAAVARRKAPDSVRQRTRGGRVAHELSTTLAVLLVLGLTFFLNRDAVSAVPRLAAALATEERAAMALIAADSPPTAQYLVVSGDGWAFDRSSEWFPVLAGRTSLGTVQGTEWLPDRQFLRRRIRHSRLQECGARDGACLDRWAREDRADFAGVYVTHREEAECCPLLAAALEADPAYVPIYVSPTVSIFARRSAVQ